MVIDILPVTGSPDGVNPDELEIKGVGGAELALISFAETMSKRGHNVRIYNDPRVENGHKLFGGVWYLPKSHFASDDVRDCFISWGIKK